MADWVRITTPKKVYLPTQPPAGSESYKDSGIAVTPEDAIEILSGTHSIRINGKTYSLIIPCDALRRDQNNRIILDAPAPPVASLSAGGGDRAFVGGIGQATAAARGQWDPKIASNWKGDTASPIGKSWVDAQIRHAEQHGAFDDLEEDEQALFEDPKKKHPRNPTRLKLLEEERIVKIVTLKDGTQAEAIIDPTTGKVVSTSRIYSGIGCDPKEAAAAMAEQALEAREVQQARPVHPLR